MEPCLDAGERLGGELGGLVMSYEPLVKATAYRYMGRGAERSLTIWCRRVISRCCF